MWGITPAYLQCAGIIIHDSFTLQYPRIDKHLTFKYPSALILYGIEQKSMFRLHRETTQGVFRSNACLFFHLLIDLVRDTTSAPAFPATSLAHDSYTSLDKLNSVLQQPACGT